MTKKLRFSFGCRRKTFVDENKEVISQFHERLASALEALPKPWQVSIEPNAEIKPGNLTAVCRIGRSGKFSGRAVYKFRGENYLRDTSEFDDHLVLNFSANQDELEFFCTEIFSKLIEAFSAYRAEVTVAPIVVKDWNFISESQTDSEVDLYGRHGIYRVWPVSFYSDELISTLAYRKGAIKIDNGCMFCQPQEYFNGSCESFSSRVTAP